MVGLNHPRVYLWQHWLNHLPKSSGNKKNVDSTLLQRLNQLFDGRCESVRVLNQTLAKCLMDFNEGGACETCVDGLMISNLAFRAS